MSKRGAAAAAQCDIQQFCDSLPLMLILLWLIDKRVPSPLVVVTIRHQVCPQLTLTPGSARAVILDRCVGGLTGSRVACMLACILVESCLAERIAFWRKWDFVSLEKAMLVLSCAVRRTSTIASRYHASLRCCRDFGRSGRTSVVPVEHDNEALFQIVR